MASLGGGVGLGDLEALACFGDVEANLQGEEEERFWFCGAAISPAFCVIMILR